MLEDECTNEILVKENHQMAKAVESYEVELDNVQKKKDMVQQELDQTLQALNEIWLAHRLFSTASCLILQEIRNIRSYPGCYIPCTNWRL